MAGGLVGFIEGIPKDIEGAVSRVVRPQPALRAQVAAPQQQGAPLSVAPARAPALNPVINPLDPTNTQNQKNSDPLDLAVKAVQSAGHIAYNLADPMYHLGAGIVGGVQKTLGIPVEAVRATTAAVTGNDKAFNAAETRGHNDINTLVGGLQSIPRAADQLAETAGIQKGDINPQGPVEQALLGKAPILSLQQVAGQADKKGGVSSAIGTTAASLTGDVLALDGAAKGVKSAPDVLDSAVKRVQAANGALGEEGRLGPAEEPTSQANANSPKSQEPSSLEPTKGAPTAKPTGPQIPGEIVQVQKPSPEDQISSQPAKGRPQSVSDSSSADTTTETTNSQVQHPPTTGLDSAKYNQTGNLKVSNGNSSAWLSKMMLQTNKGMKEYIELKAINSVKAKTGSATALLGDIKRFADSEKKPIILTDTAAPKSAYSGFRASMRPESPMAQKQLTAWYEKQGFTRVNKILPDGTKIPSGEMRYKPQATAASESTKPAFGQVPEDANRRLTPQAKGQQHLPATPEDTAMNTNQVAADKQIAEGEPLASAKAGARAAKASSKGAEPYTYDEYEKDQRANGKLAINEEDFNKIFKDGTEEDQQQFRRSQAENTALNPIKRDIPTVEKSDYQQAAHNPLIASEPIKAATNLAARAAKRAGMSIQDLARAVEQPDKVGELSDKEATAVKAYRLLANLVHSTSQALGGNTNFRDNYFNHDVLLDDDPDKSNLGSIDEAGQFRGLNTMNRKYDTVDDLEKAGYNLKEQDPVKAILNYGNRAAAILHNEALRQGIEKADEGAEKQPNALVLNGKEVKFSDAAAAKLKGYRREPASTNPIVKGYRAFNRGAKHTLLSVSQYHPLNINALQAAPALIAKGHIGAAARGLADTVKSAFSPAYADKIQSEALADGTYDKAARIGTPIGHSDIGGTNRVSKALDNLIFGREVPAMHIQMVRAVVSDLEDKGVDLDSPEAKAAGKVVNNIMGFVNTKAQNLDPALQRRLGDVLLAPQFERAKLNLVGDALTKRGVAGSYARSVLFGKYATEVGLQVVGGAATNAPAADNVTKRPVQAFENNAIRAAISPGIPTGQKDKTGNNIEYKLPDSGTSEIANTLLNMSRNQGGQITVAPGGIGSDVSNTETALRDKLASLPGSGVKLLTNNNYANRPLSDPNAPAGTRAEQDATTLATDMLPISLQGIAYNKDVQNVLHLPNTVKQVLNANSPGGNPIERSALAGSGLSPESDKLNGQGLQTQQYYNTLDAATKGLNPNELAAFKAATPISKDPVTGQYINTNQNTNLADMTSLIAKIKQTYPAVGAALDTTYKTLAKMGQSVSPFYTKLSPAQQEAYTNYEQMPPGPDRTDWINKNPWYNKAGGMNFSQQLTNYYNSLPKGDPNKPASPIKYPTPTAQVAAENTAYNNIPTGENYSQARSAYLTAHPELADQWIDQDKYDNAMRVAEGYAPEKITAQMPAALQTYATAYTNASKADRTAMRTGQPSLYQQMVGYYDQSDINTINKQGAVSNLQGEPDASQSELKAISGLAPDIYESGSAASPYQIKPAGWMQGLTQVDSSGSGSSGSSSSGESAMTKYFNSEGGPFGQLLTGKAPVNAKPALPTKAKAPAIKSSDTKGKGTNFLTKLAGHKSTKATSSFKTSKTDFTKVAGKKLIGSKAVKTKVAKAPKVKATVFKTKRHH